METGADRQSSQHGHVAYVYLAQAIERLEAVRASGETLADLEAVYSLLLDAQGHLVDLPTERRK